MNQDNSALAIPSRSSTEPDEVSSVIVDNSEELESSQFLTFMLDGEVFGLSILSVKEILEYRELTGIPMAPPFIRGVINLRSKAIPVIDLNVRFGGPRKDISKKSCIIIVETTFEKRTNDVGLLVDAVNEVVDIPKSKIEPPPQMGLRINTDYIFGMGNINDIFIILLEQKNLLSVSELFAVNNLVNETGQ